MTFTAIFGDAEGEGARVYIRGRTVQKRGEKKKKRDESPVVEVKVGWEA
jgi:hypothetical protein